MKRILLSAVLLLACGAVQAQFNIRVYNMSEVLKAKPIDKVLFTAQYDLSATQPMKTNTSMRL